LEDLQVTVSMSWSWSISPAQLVSPPTLAQFQIGRPNTVAGDVTLGNVKLTAFWSVNVDIALVETSGLTAGQSGSAVLSLVDRDASITCELLGLDNLNVNNVNLGSATATKLTLGTAQRSAWSAALRIKLFAFTSPSASVCQLTVAIVPQSGGNFFFAVNAGSQQLTSPVVQVGGPVAPTPPPTPVPVPVPSPAPSPSSIDTTVMSSPTDSTGATTSESITDSSAPADTTSALVSNGGDTTVAVDDTESPPSGVPIGGIVGGIVGGLVLLLCVAVAIVFILRRSSGGETIETSRLESGAAAADDEDEARHSGAFVSQPSAAVAIPPPLTDRPVVVSTPMPVWSQNAAPPPPLASAVGSPGGAVPPPPPPPPPGGSKSGSKSPRGPGGVQYTGLPNSPTAPGL
jgi:hypothetical protein